MLFYAGFLTSWPASCVSSCCKYMCPYARFQGVMFDPDTLIITYDANAASRAVRAEKTMPKRRLVTAWILKLPCRFARPVSTYATAFSTNASPRGLYRCLSMP